MQSEFCFWGTFFFLVLFLSVHIQWNAKYKTTNTPDCWPLRCCVNHCDGMLHAVLPLTFITLGTPVDFWTRLSSFSAARCSTISKKRGGGGDNWNVYRIHELDACFDTVFHHRHRIVELHYSQFCVCVCVLYIYNFCYCLMVWLYVWAYIMVTYF